MPVSWLHKAMDEEGGLLKRWQPAVLMQRAPKFVFTNAVLGFVSDNIQTYQAVLLAFLGAGFTDLTENPIVVEYDRDGYRWFWLVKEAPGHPGTYHCRFIAWHPGYVGFVNAVIPVRVSGKTIDTLAWINDLPDDDTDLSTPDAIRMLDYHNTEAVNAVLLALCLNIKGIVTRRPEPVSDALDHARMRRGKSPLTRDYVTVHIGYRIDRHGRLVPFHKSNRYRLAMRPHNRRGHLRMQVCGPGREERKVIQIAPTTVNGGAPHNPDYLVVP